MSVDITPETPLPGRWDDWTLPLAYLCRDAFMAGTTACKLAEGYPERAVNPYPQGTYGRAAWSSGWNHYYDDSWFSGQTTDKDVGYAGKFPLTRRTIAYTMATVKGDNDMTTATASHTARIRTYAIDHFGLYLGTIQGTSPMDARFNFAEKTFKVYGFSAGVLTATVIKGGAK